MVDEIPIQGDRLCSRGARGVDFDEFILYNVNMVNVTFLPKLEGKRTFEFELALKTKSEEVTFAIFLSESKSLSKVTRRLSLASGVAEDNLELFFCFIGSTGPQGRAVEAQVKVEGEETVEEMLQYGQLCQRTIYYADKSWTSEEEAEAVIRSSGTSRMGSNDSLVNMEEDL